jgi:hypothetical protein
MLKRSTVFYATLGAIACAGAGIPAGPVIAAVTPPTPTQVNLGSFGPIQISGGFDSYGYVMSGAGDKQNYGLLGTDKNAGAVIQNGVLQVQKTQGLVQFNVAVGGYNFLSLGYKPSQTSTKIYSTGPVQEAVLTLAPTKNWSFSAGQIPSIEGYEGTYDWQNPSIVSSAIYQVQNTQSVGISATYTSDKITGTVIFSDGWDTNVWNYLQVLTSYTFNDSNQTSVWGATNLGRTGQFAHYYGSILSPYGDTTVASAGAANFVNSSNVGGFHKFTHGNLTIVPEVQYVWVQPDQAVGLHKFSSNFAAALFPTYQFGKSPWSLGGFVDFVTSNGPSTWFLNSGSQGYGISIAPTWQTNPAWAHGRNLFVRANGGWRHLTRIGNPGTVGYGANGLGRNMTIWMLEGGFLF